MQLTPGLTPDLERPAQGINTRVNGSLSSNWFVGTLFDEMVSMT